MNDSMSILLATTVLALGGLGLYMYKLDKSTDDNDTVDDDFSVDDSVSDTNIFSKFFNWDDKTEEEPDEILDNYEEEEYVPRKRSNTKTHKNKKTGSSRRKY